MLYIPHDRNGQGLVEYALILVLVTIVVIATLLVFGTTLANMFVFVSNELESITP